MMVHFVAILLIASEVAAAIIVRLPCKSYANFSIEQPDYVLQGYVFATFLFQSLYDCKVKCLMDAQCKSINLLDGGNRTCQLNSRTTEDVLDGVYLTKRIGWTFTTTNYSSSQQGENCLANNPCPSNVLCKDQCVCPGYQCLPCPEGFGGLYCNEAKYCKITVKGAEYRGNTNVTKSGLQCQDWDSQFPHSHNTTSENFPRSGLTKNFCRNPGLQKDYPWCYTANSNTRWEYCNIKRCGIDTGESTCSWSYSRSWLQGDVVSCANQNHVVTNMWYDWHYMDMKCCKLEGPLCKNHNAESGHSVDCGPYGFINRVKQISTSQKTTAYSFRYLFGCCQLNASEWQTRISCYMQHTQFEYSRSLEYYSPYYQNLYCADKFALSYFRLQSNNNQTKWRYQYRCCKIEFQ